MKRLTRVVLLANGAFQVGAGLVLFSSPGWLFPGVAGQATGLAHALAVTALAFGLLSLLLWAARTGGWPLMAGLMTLAAFHFGLSVVYSFGAARGQVIALAPVCHLLGTLSFALALARELRR